MLSLNLPALGDTPRHLVRTDPKEVKAWLVSLPDGNWAETARIMADALTALNRIKLDDDERLPLVELYQVKIDILYGVLEAAFVVPSLPARDKQKQAANLTKTLYAELSIGYKRALVDRLERRFSFGMNRQVPVIMLLALQALQRVLLICYKSYTPVPDGVWLDVHRLFRYAVQHKLLDEPLGDGLAPIGVVYKQILLLALADPQRMSQAELELATEVVRGYAHAAQFQPLMPLSNPAGFFLVRLDSDVPAQYIGQRPADIDPRTDVLLDTMELSRQLHKALAVLDAKSRTTSDLGRLIARQELLHTLIRQWGIAPMRAFNRMRTNASVLVVTGLRSCNYYMNGELPIFAAIDLLVVLL
jgi:hypothetical protein